MKPYDASYFDHDCCKPFFMPGGSTGILFLHGFTGSIAHMRPLADALHARGYTVKGINLPGHATTEQDMGRSNWEQWLQAAKEGVVELKKTVDKTVVCGLSMGGVLSLLIAEQMRIDACVTVSAPMAVQNKLMGLANVLGFVYPRISWAPPTERHKALNQAYDYGYSGFPTRKAADLNRLIHMARQNLFAVQCPLLAVQSTGDETIWAGSADCILQNASSEMKQKLLVRDVPHVCTISKELPSIVEAVDELLKAL